MLGLCCQCVIKCLFIKLRKRKHFTIYHWSPTKVYHISIFYMFCTFEYLQYIFQFKVVKFAVIKNTCGSKMNNTTYKREVTSSFYRMKYRFKHNWHKNWLYDDLCSWFFVSNTTSVAMRNTFVHVKILFERWGVLY